MSWHFPQQKGFLGQPYCLVYEVNSKNLNTKSQYQTEIDQLMCSCQLADNTNLMSLMVHGIKHLTSGFLWKLQILEV